MFGFKINEFIRNEFSLKFHESKYIPNISSAIDFHTPFDKAISVSI